MQVKFILALFMTVAVIGALIPVEVEAGINYIVCRKMLRNVARCKACCESKGYQHWYEDNSCACKT